MRTKNVVYTRHRKKKYFRRAKGYYSDKKNRWRQVLQQVEKSLTHAYRDRKDRKGNFRRQWIIGINAFSRNYNIPYSKFIYGLQKAGVSLNRKMLAEMALNDKGSFENLVEVAKKSLSN